jgi:hypothetical protein
MLDNYIYLYISMYWIIYLFCVEYIAYYSFVGNIIINI